MSDAIVVWEPWASRTRGRMFVRPVAEAADCRERALGELAARQEEALMDDLADLDDEYQRARWRLAGGTA